MKSEKKLARSLNFTFGDFFYPICLIELEIKDITDTARFASYLDIHLEIISEGQVKTKLKFHIVNFSFICNNILAAPAFGVYIYIYISHLVRY